MPIATYTKYPAAIEPLMENINSGTDAWKVALAATINSADTTFVPGTTDLATGNGYTAGGNAATTSSATQTGGVYKLTEDGDFLVTESGDKIIAWIDDGAYLLAEDGKFIITEDGEKIWAVEDYNVRLLTESGWPLITEDGIYIIAQANLQLSCCGGEYVVVGHDATINRGKTVNAGYGSYTVTGQSVTILRGNAINAGYGSYTVTGQSVDIVKTRIQTLGTGYYVLTGQNVNLVLDRVIQVQKGDYSITGFDATINYGPGPTPIADDLLDVRLRSLTERRRN